MRYVIAGPTASGKSAVAVALARRIGGEIVNADSVQVYAGLDIGTAKPTLEERQGVPHHLLDIVGPAEAFSAARYQALALAAIADIEGRGRVPVITGGTGFYINAVVYGTAFTGAGESGTGDTGTAARHEMENTLREQYAALAAAQGAQALHAVLAARDPFAAAAIHPNNIKRTARALAFCEVSGALFSAYNASERDKKQRALPPDILYAVLTLPRAQLYARINARVEAMLAAGLVREVAGLLAAGYAPDLPAMGAIGYKETAAALICNGGEPINEEALAPRIAQATRRYAKRQITWFNNSAPHARYIDASCGDAERIAETILAIREETP